MDSRDLARFAEWFDVLAITHGKNFPSEDMKARVRGEYFDVLRPYSIESVSGAYETLRRRAKKWPLPADWAEAMPPRGSADNLPLMTPSEQRENDAAERLGYEAEHYCHCVTCERDDATHLKPRFVPIENPDGSFNQRRHPLRSSRPVILGRWIHGHELKRWYAAKAEFYTKLHAIKAADANSRAARLSQFAAGMIASETSWRNTKNMPKP